jgi:hypothetical protein
MINEKNEIICCQKKVSTKQKDDEKRESLRKREMADI